MPLPDTQQQNRALQFKQLHHNGRLLVLPNIWDPLGAALLEQVGYAAIATASASVAYSNGYPDGEKISFNEVVTILHKITGAVALPVTADIESGYAEDDDTFNKNIERLLDSGIAGINIEDTHHQSHNLQPMDTQCLRIARIRQIASAKGIPLFINARTDVYLHGEQQSEKEKLEETIRRGKVYKDAGADGFYPMLLKSERDIEVIVNKVNLPINILLLPGIPSFNRLQQMGVARLSLGPGFLKIALNAIKNTAVKLLHYEGLEEVVRNLVNAEDIKSLIKNKT